MHRRRRPLLALLAAVITLTAACSGDADPEDAFADAVAETFDGSYRYEITIEADRSALGGLGDDAPQATALLAGLGIEGAVTDDGSSFAVGVLGSPLLEVRTVEAGAFLRLGIEDLLSAFGGGFDPRADLEPALAALGLEPDVQTAILAAIGGAWVGIEGGIDTTAIAELFGVTGDGDGTQTELPDALGGDLEGFVERYIIVSEAAAGGGDDVEEYDVEVQLRELLRDGAASGDGDGAVTDADLAELPETLPGTVTVQDGLIQAITVDVAAAARAQGAAGEGALVVRIDLSDHDAVDAIETPSAEVTITSEQLTTALERLAGLTVGVPEAGS